jgi:hypothetical protein
LIKRGTKSNPIQSSSQTRKQAKKIFQVRAHKHAVIILEHYQEFWEQFTPHSLNSSKNLPVPIDNKFGAQENFSRHQHLK